jgi:DNA-binding NarL/FixJ family response regulator
VPGQRVKLFLDQGEVRMAEISEKSFISVVDEMPLRRALITQFLSDWGKSLGFLVISRELEDATTLEDFLNCKLVILSIGVFRPSEPKILEAHRAFAATNPNLPVVVIGDRPNAENVEQALKAGMAGYIPMSLGADVAVAALNFVLAGGRYIPPEALLQHDEQEPIPPFKPRALPPLQPKDTLSRKPPEPTKTNGGEGGQQAFQREADRGSDCNAPARNLTGRQRQVLACLKNARSNKEIARELDMSEATVKVHVRQVMRKLGATNRTHAAVIGMAPSFPVSMTTVRLASIAAPS